MIVTVHEAKSQLSKLIKAVEAGEEVIIARRDKPVVRLSQYEKPRLKPSDGFGCLKGYFTDEAIEQLTSNPDLDQQIEEDFYAFEKEGKDS